MKSEKLDAKTTAVLSKYMAAYTAYNSATAATAVKMLSGKNG